MELLMAIWKKKSIRASSLERFRPQLPFVLQRGKNTRSPYLINVMLRPKKMSVDFS